MSPMPIMKKSTNNVHNNVHYNVHNNVHYMQCCMCEDHHHNEKKMKCGHLVCGDCLEHIREMKCPTCYDYLEGPLMYPEIIEDIEDKMRQDKIWS